MDILNQKIVKDLKIVLKDFEPMVKDPRYLWTGRKIKNFSLSPREAWANWLICVVLRKVHNRDITFMDDNVGDGFIVDKTRNIVVPTEHVCALDIPEGKKLIAGEQRVIDMINHKIKRGPDYARGKLLVVFFDGAGIYYRNKIREAIFCKHNFDAVFCVGLLNSDETGYSYAVTEFRDSFEDTSITHRVNINSSFDSWQVTQII